MPGTVNDLFCDVEPNNCSVKRFWRLWKVRAERKNSGHGQLSLLITNNHKQQSWKVGSSWKILEAV